MHSSKVVNAVHKPLIRFVGSRQTLWKSSPPHHGPHPLTPANLEKHVPKPEPVSTKTVPSNTGFITMNQIPNSFNCFKTLPITEAEMEAIELGGASRIY
ncbi:unnamed protein product [Cunninghamella blakesleeana]